MKFAAATGLVLAWLTQPLLGLRLDEIADDELDGQVLTGNMSHILDTEAPAELTEQEAMDQDHRVAVLYEGKVVQALVLLDAKAHAAGQFSLGSLAAGLAAKVRAWCPGYIAKACLKVVSKSAWTTILQVCAWVATWFAWAGAGVQGVISGYCARTVSNTMKTALKPGMANFGSQVCIQMGL